MNTPKNTPERQSQHGSGVKGVGGIGLSVGPSPLSPQAIDMFGTAKKTSAPAPAHKMPSLCVAALLLRGASGEQSASPQSQNSPRAPPHRPLPPAQRRPPDRFDHQRQRKWKGAGAGRVCGRFVIRVGAPRLGRRRVGRAVIRVY